MHAGQINSLREFVRTDRTLLAIVMSLALTAAFTAVLCETGAITKLMAACRGLDLIVSGHEIVGLKP